MNILLLIVASAWYALATDEVQFELIPHEILCPFCIALIGRFQQTAEQNPAYKQVLCESLSGKNSKNYDSCIESFNEITVEKLKSSNAEDLCKKQKLCSPHQKKVILMANNGKPDFPDIPPVTDEQREDAKKHNILENIGDILDGKLENPKGENLTLYIDLKFQRPNYNETETSTNSTVLLTESSTNSTEG